MSSSNPILLPSPELDGDFDPSIHLTPTRTPHQHSVRFMKSAVQIYTPEDEVDMSVDIRVDMRDSSSPNGGAERHFYVRDQSSSPVLAAMNNPLDAPTYLASSTVFQMAALASAMEDVYGHDDYDDGYDLQYCIPPSTPPARGMYIGSTLETRHHPFQVSNDSSMLSPSSTLISSQSPSFASSREGNSTTSSGSLSSTTSGGSINNGSISKTVPTKRRRSLHVRSKFVLDGNFSFVSTTKSSFERAVTIPLSAMEQQQQQQQRSSISGCQEDPSSCRTNRNFSSSHIRNHAVSTPSFTMF
jgi:hypothetical protein